MGPAVVPQEPSMVPKPHNKRDSDSCAYVHGHFSQTQWHMCAIISLKMETYNNIQNVLLLSV